MSTIWKELQRKAQETNRSFTVLAPMEDVTDIVFRSIVQKVGRPDVFFTEFTNCDGLQSRGRDHVIHRLQFLPEHQPIIAQVWGRNPETYALTIPLLIEMGFKGVDINMGCPVPKVIKNNAGGGLIREPQLASEIIDSVKEAINKYCKNDFVLSIKTRLGFSHYEEEWLSLLLHKKLDALTIHLRTVKEMTKVPAQWERMKDIITLKEKISPETVIIGNGDITTKEQLNTYRALYSVDGLMVGRGIFTNLWLFSQDKDEETVTKRERLELLKLHINTFAETWGKNKNFELLKKFFKVYLNRFDGAHQLRNDLNLLKTREEMVKVLDAALA